MRVIVLLGAPGAGKGTQATLLAERLGLLPVASGDLFRAAVQDDTRLGREVRSYMERGGLVPDDVTVRVVIARLTEADARPGVLLDGFPRTRSQAEALDAALARQRNRVERALYIDVPTETLVRRLSGRWVCRAGGHVFHETANPPRQPGVCDMDGSELIRRADDRAEIVRARLAEQLAPMYDVVDYYRDRGVLCVVAGDQPIANVTDELLAALGVQSLRR